MAKKKVGSQTEFVKEWFIKRPNRDVSHEESKAEIEAESFKITKKRFEDVDRSIRKLAQIGFLIKVKINKTRIFNNYKVYTKFNKYRIIKVYFKNCLKIGILMFFINI